MPPKKQQGKPKAKKAQQKQGGQGKQRARAIAARRMLDADALRYAKLLVDPCSAPLVHPVYTGSDAGFLFRAESVFTVGNGATGTAGFVHWTPGYVNTSNTELLIGAAADAVTGMPALVDPNAPGKTFLTTNATSMRCVAACMRIVYPGTEANRAGRLHYGHTLAAYMDAGDTRTANEIAVGLQSYTRTPPEAVEVVWKPSAADQEFCDPSIGANGVVRDRRSSVTAAWAGIPVSTGMTFYLTAIYEWLPRPGVGISTNPTGKNPSRNTLDNVIDFIQEKGYTWSTHTAGAMGTGIGAGLVAGLANAYGRMSARPYYRRVGMY